VRIDPEWIALAIVVVSFIAAMARDRQRIGDQVKKLTEDAEDRAIVDRRRHKAIVNRIMDLEKAYGLIGLSDDERARRAALPRAFVPRATVEHEADDPE
jgi:hypothetical protein